MPQSNRKKCALSKRYFPEREIPCVCGKPMAVPSAGNRRGKTITGR